ncbi:MAG TPA: YfhO family protein [Planktothrix sp.]
MKEPKRYSSRLKNVAGDWLPWIVVIVVTLLVFREFLQVNENGIPHLLLHWDFTDVTVPWLVYASDCIRAGFWPLWCPYVACGSPHFLNPESNLYSPLTFLISLTSGYTPYIAQIQSILIIVVGAVGAYCLSLELWKSRWGACVAGICFGLTSAVFGNLELIAWIDAFAAMPWLFWLLHRWVVRGNSRALVGLSFLFYWLITTAYPAAVVQMLAWALIWIVFLLKRERRDRLQWIRSGGGVLFAGLMAVAVSTVHWLPTIELRNEFTRGQALTIEAALKGDHLELRHLLGLLFNFLPKYPLPGGYNPDVSMRGLYIGVLALPLAAIGMLRRRDTFSVALTIFSVLAFCMSMGIGFPGRVMLHHLFPILNFSRFPAGDSRTLFALGLILLAGRGFATIESGEKRDRLLGLGILGALFVSLLAGGTWLGQIDPDGFAPYKLFWLVEAGLILLGIATWLKINRSWARALYIFLLVVDLSVAFQANVSVAGEQPHYYDTFLSKHQSTFTPDFAILPREIGSSSDPPDLDVYHCVPSSWGYVSKEFFVGDYNPVRLIRLNRLISSGMLDYLQSGQRVMIWPTDDPPKSSQDFLARAIPVSFEIEAYHPNDVRYSVTALSAGFLVFNEVYFPGWRAKIDDRDLPMQEMSGGLRAIPITPGAHHVVTYFAPPIFPVALTITLCSLVAWLGWAGWIVVTPALKNRSTNIPGNSLAGS